MSSSHDFLRPMRRTTTTTKSSFSTTPSSRGTLSLLASYQVTPKSLQPLSSSSSSLLLHTAFNLHILQGSICDYRGGAIVNAANEGCLGGGGVDGAIAAYGGWQLYEARQALPIRVAPDIRCPAGSAVVTTTTGRRRRHGRVSSDTNTDTTTTINDTTNDDSYCWFGSLQVPCVIHAVGPDYWNYQGQEEQANIILMSAYQSALSLAEKLRLRDVAFSLLSAGVYRGPNRSLQDILSVSIRGIKTWAAARNRRNSTTPAMLRDIYMCAFTEEECRMLLLVCSQEFGNVEHVGRKPGNRV
jgi:O-acetyl-ADP-ribose deacetylase